MNEDKENLMYKKFDEIRKSFWKEYKDVNSIPKIDIALKKAFEETISQSNKALLTKLRGEALEIKAQDHLMYEPATDLRRGYVDGFNQAKDQDIALIDKYLEENEN